MPVIGHSAICILLSFTCQTCVLIRRISFITTMRHIFVHDQYFFTCSESSFEVFIFSSEISALFLFPFTRLSSGALDFKHDLIFLSFFSLYVHPLASHQPTWLNVFYFTFQAFIYLRTRHFWRHYFTSITCSTALTFRTFTTLNLWLYISFFNCWYTNPDLKVLMEAVEMK